MKMSHRFVSLTVGCHLLLYTQLAGASFELYRSSTLLPKTDEVHIVRTMGLSQKNALIMDGDPNGTACSNRHEQNDISNRWCHSFFVKIVNEKLLEMGMPKYLSALASASIFVPKEFLVDKNPSAADLVIADLELYEFAENLGRISISVFGDGAAAIGIEKKF